MNLESDPESRKAWPLPAPMDPMGLIDRVAVGAAPTRATASTEVLQWHPVSEKPDAGITVLMWHAADCEFWCGWWDDELQGWIGAESGGSVLGVTHWAMPQGPQC